MMNTLVYAKSRAKNVWGIKHDITFPANYIRSVLCKISYSILCVHRFSGDDEIEEEETTEADGELQIITECWLEPQYGDVVFSPPERQHFDGLTYKQLPDAVSCSFSITIHVHTFKHSFMHSFTHVSFSLPITRHPNSFMHVFIHSFIHSFVCLFIHASIHSFTHSRIDSHMT